MEYQKITKVSKNSERVTNENDKEISKERYMFLKERHKVINNLRPIVIV